jgi:hypothetical protein
MGMIEGFTLSGMATEFRIHNFPEAVHKALKLRSVELNVPLNDLIIQILTEAAQKAEKGKK